MALEIPALESQPAGHPGQSVALNERDRLDPEQLGNAFPGTLTLSDRSHGCTELKGHRVPLGLGPR